MNPLRAGLKTVRSFLRRSIGRALAQRKVARAPEGHLKVVIGSGPTRYRGWLATQLEILDLCDVTSFDRLFGQRQVDAFLAEHVWEHLTTDQGVAAATNCYRYMRKGARLRIAVPDGLSTIPGYIDDVKPGGSGSGSEDHKVLYTHSSLEQCLVQAGFEVRKLEYFCEDGTLVTESWAASEGPISRSVGNDPRNRNGLGYTSLIVDAIKP